ncbi:MAG: discoidin domain-containing protein, partial [Planctomycetes bacterium]|nr:discoidin domain-containing protein [Planctomycetota bacterium]
SKAASATSERGGGAAFAPANALDGRIDTYWAAADGVTTAALEVDLGRPVTFNRAVIQEYVRLGQRVMAFAFDAWDGGAWREVSRGQTIGYKRILRFPAVTAPRVRLRIEQARACPTISTLGLYRSAEA